MTDRPNRNRGMILNHRQARRGEDPIIKTEQKAVETMMANAGLSPDEVATFIADERLSEAKPSSILSQKEGGAEKVAEFKIEGAEKHLLGVIATSWARAADTTGHEGLPSPEDVNALITLNKDILRTKLQSAGVDPNLALIQVERLEKSANDMLAERFEPEVAAARDGIKR